MLKARENANPVEYSSKRRPIIGSSIVINAEFNNVLLGYNGYISIFANTLKAFKTKERIQL